MNVWYHLSTIFSRRHVLLSAGLIALCVALITTLIFANATHAAPGVNQTISFQGRLSKPTGGIVADGYYNIQFKIYQDGAGTAVTNPGGTLEWTENYVNNGGTSGVQVKNGYFNVTLGSVNPFGSSVDWNQDTLWLSMNVAGTATGCTTFGSGACTSDGEMLPMKRMTSTPFALNSGMLGGKTADGFIQNGTSPQTADFYILEPVQQQISRGITSVTAPAFDRADAGSLTIGTTNATSITIGYSGTTTAVAGVLAANTFDSVTPGTLTIGGTNATSINLAQDVTVAAGKSLTLNGGNTASRPASPTEGMLYFDTTTKQLLVYANGKWQADRSTASKIVGTSATGGTSSAVASANADGADYVNTSTTSAQTTINSALSVIGSNGGSVYLMEGTYIIDGSISIPNNVTLVGSGSGTIIKLKNSINADIDVIVATDATTGTGVKVSNIRIDGNKANNSSGIQNGIYFNNMGGGNGSSARQGTKLSDLWISNLRNYGIMLENSNNGIISSNNINNSNMGIYLKTASYMTVTGNILQGNARGLYASPMNTSTVSGNTFESSSAYGALFDGTSFGNTITANTFNNNATAGISLATANDNAISGNRFRNNGGSTTNEGVNIGSNSDRNSITSNTISDDTCSTNCYAINITGSSSDANYLSDNTVGSNGTINDLGTATVYANQLDGNGTLINKSSTGTTVQTSSNSTFGFRVQNAAGTSALRVDTTNNSVLVAGSIDTTAAAALTLGSATATSITIGNASSNIATTVLGTAVFKPTTGNNSTTSFQLQRADGTAMLTADSTNQTIAFGNSASGNYTLVSTSTGAITKYGNARNTKKITLNAEYTGSVLDAGSGSNNTGTMTSSVDLTNRMNYYKWTTSQGSNQSYDVVVQVPIPSDFDGWASSNPLSISTYTSNTTNGTITFEARDSSNAVQCNFVSVTPGSTGAWATNTSACTLSSGTYTAGDTMTLRIRMQSPNGGDVRVGNINLSYLSKY